MGPDNVYFRTRLRQAHPETEDAMREQRRACLEVRSALNQDTLWTVAEKDLGTQRPGHQLPLQLIRPQISAAKCSQSALRS